MLERSRDPELRELAAGILYAQEAEIKAMNRVRKREFGGPVRENKSAGGHGAGHSG